LNAFSAGASKNTKQMGLLAIKARLWEQLPNRKGPCEERCTKEESRL
jgi:hypothetical protein